MKAFAEGQWPPVTTADVRTASGGSFPEPICWSWSERADAITRQNDKTNLLAMLLNRRVRLASAMSVALY